MKRKEFVVSAGLFGVGSIFFPGRLFSLSSINDFPIVRVALDKRKFTSPAVEDAIANFKKKVSNKELAWLFGKLLSQYFRYNS